MSEQDLALTFPYTATQLTDQVNRVPNLFGLVNEMDLFPVEGSISTIVEIRYEDGVLRVLPSKERGSPSTPMAERVGKTVFLEIPHFPAMDVITPKDLQNLTVINARTKRPITLEEEVAKRLINIRNTHAITLEWCRSSALQGVIKDGNSGTVYDLYAAFDIQKTTVFFDLDNTASDIVGKCAAVWQAVTGNLKGETMRAIEAVVDPTFFNKLVGHTAVKAFYQNAEQALMLANLVRRQSAGAMWGREFLFQNILFREYYGTAPVKSSPTAAITSTPFWASNTGTAFPVGTMNTFRTYFAPANDLRFVNQTGQELYVSPKILEHGQGVELKSESDPLAVCNRPEVLVQLSGAAI
ncbi:MAG: hypothetical protein GC182_08565 [Rhodopseudomonas sp.]|nr:hypothetical protein [Rhodopseudomonas sp.]